MLHQDVDVEDLRNEIFNLRKHIARVCSENQILKVKIKKLQDEMIRRDRQLDEFLHSKKCFGLSKNLQEKGAAVIVNLKLKNDKLEQIIVEKDITIRRLQNTLQTAKLYNANSLTKKFASKAVECSLLHDNKLEHKKSKLNNKIELFLPNFNTNLFRENDEIQKGMSEKTDSAESNIMFELNQKSTSAYPKVRHGKIQRTEEKSDKAFENEIFSSLPEVEAVKNDLDLVDPTSENSMNPTFQKILQSVEELMRRGSAEVNVSRKISIDEAIQCPQESNTDEQIVSATENVENPEKNLEINSLEALETLENTEIIVEDHQKESEIVNVDEIEEKRRSGEMPHEEIKQLQVHLMDMICQVDNLKDTIFQLKTDQKKTQSFLKSKDENIEKLAKEVKQLRELHSITSSGKENLSAPNPNIEPAEKEETVETEQKTKKNPKSNAGKLKRIKNTKSKSSISDHTVGKLSRTSSKHSKSDKCLSGEKLPKKKIDKKLQNALELKTVFGNGNGDVVEVPFYKYNLVQSCDLKNDEKTDFDELD